MKLHEALGRLWRTVRAAEAASVDPTAETLDELRASLAPADEALRALKLAGMIGSPPQPREPRCGELHGAATGFAGITLTASELRELAGDLADAPSYRCRPGDPDRDPFSGQVYGDEL